MTERDFIYWLNGFAELTEGNVITEQQWIVIKQHLSLVMNKQTGYKDSIFKQTPLQLDLYPKLNTDLIC
jgi:hypothetical protein